MHSVLIVHQGPGYDEPCGHELELELCWVQWTGTAGRVRGAIAWEPTSMLRYYPVSGALFEVKKRSAGAFHLQVHLVL